MDNNQQNSILPNNGQNLPKSGISQQASPIINLEKELSPETVKYSIHTMAQDLEHAKKEAIISVTAKIPATLPPPPVPAMPPSIAPKISPEKPIPPPPLVAPAIPVLPPTQQFGHQPIPPLIVAEKTPITPPFPPSPIIPPLLRRSIPPIVPAPEKLKILPIYPLGPKSAPILPSPFPELKIKPQIYATPAVPAGRQAILATQLQQAMPPERPQNIPPPIPKQSLLSRLPISISISHLNLAIIAIAVILFLTGGVGFSYWWFFIKEIPASPIITEELPPPVIIGEPNLPEKIATTESDIIIQTETKIISSETTSSLISQISGSTQKINDKELARILIKHSSETEKSFLSFSESLAMLDIIIPEAITNEIRNGEILAFSQNGKIHHGFIAKISDGVAILNNIALWQKYILEDLKNLYVKNQPEKSQEIIFKDDLQGNFIIKQADLSSPDISLVIAISDEDKKFIVATSKDMLYKIADIKIPIIRTFSNGTLARAEGDTKIYRIIDGRKLWIPSVKVFLSSGYAPNSEIEITQEELKSLGDVKYIKTEKSASVYEIKNDKKYLMKDPGTINREEIKIATTAEFNAYPIGK